MLVICKFFLGRLCACSFFGLTVSLVLGSRYEIPSDSYARESCGFLIVLERSGIMDNDNTKI